MRTPFKRGWKERARRFLAQSPYCVDCGAPATDADHIQARAQGGGDEWANLAARCHACHSRRTANVEGHGWAGFNQARHKAVDPSTMVNPW